MNPLYFLWHPISTRELSGPQIALAITNTGDVIVSHYVEYTNIIFYNSVVQSAETHTI